MTTLAAHGSYFRIQDNMARNGMELSNNMQRLSSGLKNITAGSRAGDVAITNSLATHVTSLQYGENNARTAVAALEIAVADLSRMSDIILRLYEMNAVAGSSFATTDDKAMLKEEHAVLKAEIASIGGKIKYKGKNMAAATTSIEIGSVLTGTNTINIGFGGVAALDSTSTDIQTGAAKANLTKDKLMVDKLRLAAASRYNIAAWGAQQAANSVSAAKQELSFYKDVDFAGETSELAKNQIIAQAGTAMLAQANAQGQGILALLQT